MRGEADNHSSSPLLGVKGHVSARVTRCVQNSHLCLANFHNISFIHGDVEARDHRGLLSRSDQSTVRASKLFHLNGRDERDGGT